MSVDSVYTHKMWIEAELSKMANGTIPYPMLTDDTRAISQAYDVYDAQKGASLRGTFIICPKGYIQSMEVLTTPVGRSTSEILRQLKAFQHYVSTQNLIPADWNPGDKTLVESVDNVGKIWTLWEPKIT